MNGSLALIDEFAHRLVDFELPDNVTIVLLPPVGYLESAAKALRGSPVQLGAQNAHSEIAGAYTGEISPEMVRELGASWMLVGHSERREYFAETDDLVAEKFVAAVRAELKPILCVGESLEQRQAGQAELVVRAQLRAVADRVGAEGFARGALAYEPVWAIGTGHTATPEQAQAMHAAIRAEIASVDVGMAEQMRVLYGGSMNTENAQKLLGERDVDGGLIGGASLQADGFAAILAAAGAMPAAAIDHD